MSKEKSTIKQNDATRRVPRDLHGAEVPGEKESALDVKVVSLKIEEDLDLGGDPYNRTGSYCIITPREDD